MALHCTNVILSTNMNMTCLLIVNMTLVVSFQSILKRLERDGVRNVVFTDCLRQQDDNVKKVRSHDFLGLCFSGTHVKTES